MAGKPIERAFKERIRQIGGEKVLFERIANGETLAAIGKDFQISRWIVSKVLKRTPELEVQFRAAYRAQAAAHAERGLEILDEVPTDAGMPQVANARNRAEYRRWLAKVSDKSAYGNEAGTSVTVGVLHLDALKAKGRPPGVLVEVRQEASEDDPDELSNPSGNGGLLGA